MFKLVDLQENIRLVREQSPLIVALTNTVAMNTNANTLLACGAAPMMTHTRRALDEVIAKCQAVVINLGTIDETRSLRLQAAIEAANRHHKLVILDPVGCGGTTFNTQLARQFTLLAHRLVIRGNASEILALSGAEHHGRGVDSGDPSEYALISAQQLLQRHTDKELFEISISGATDYVLTEHGNYQLANGAPLMTQVTGTGCSLSCITAAYRAVHPAGAITAAAIMSIAGEIAAQTAQGPASLQIQLIDTLYQLSLNATLPNLNWHYLA